MAALFTIAKTWKQFKYPSIEEWIKKMWYIYTMEYYSAIKRNKLVPFAEIWIDLETVIQSEASQKEKHILQYCLYVESRKNSTDELTGKEEIESQV